MIYSKKFYAKQGFVLLLMFVFCLQAGCMRSGAPLRIATGGSGGLYYALGDDIATSLENILYGNTLAAVATEGSVSNLHLLRDETVMMAIAPADVCYYAKNGKAQFAAPMDNFGAIASLYAESYHIIAKPYIESIEKLEGKKVAIGAADSTLSYSAKQILQAYDLWPEDLALMHLSFFEAMEAFVSGEIDAFFCVGEAPIEALVHFAKQNDFNLLEIENSKADALIASNPFYVKYEIPDGYYDGISDPVHTVSMRAILIASNTLPEHMIRQFTEALFEPSEPFTQEKLRTLTPQYAASGLPIPLHSGAESYYKEKEIL